MFFFCSRKFWEENATHLRIRKYLRGGVDFCVSSKKRLVGNRRGDGERKTGDNLTKYWWLENVDSIFHIQIHCALVQIRCAGMVIIEELFFLEIESKINGMKL